MKNNEIPLVPGCCYHIYNHANGFENLFRNTGNYHYFLKKAALYLPPVAEVIAYCLMPNHIHFMVRIKKLEELPEEFQLSDKPLSNQLCHQFGKLFNAYAQAFNKQQKRRGGLFIPNFKRKPVLSQSYFNNLIRYIHQNPVAHKFVDHPGEWPHSSYLSMFSEKPSRLVREEVLGHFGGCESFITAHKTMPDELFMKIVGQWNN